jgi:hypothetical protein
VNERTTDTEALAAAGEPVVARPTVSPAWGHDVPHPIGDPDEDEELPGDDEDGDEDDDDEDDEEPMQV